MLLALSIRVLGSLAYPLQFLYSDSVETLTGKPMNTTHTHTHTHTICLHQRHTTLHTPTRFLGGVCVRLCACVSICVCVCVCVCVYVCNDGLGRVVLTLHGLVSALGSHHASSGLGDGWCNGARDVGPINTMIKRNSSTYICMGAQTHTQTDTKHTHTHTHFSEECLTFCSAQTFMSFSLYLTTTNPPPPPLSSSCFITCSNLFIVAAAEASNKTS